MGGLTDDAVCCASVDVDVVDVGVNSIAADHVQLFSMVMCGVCLASAVVLDSCGVET